MKIAGESIKLPPGDVAVFPRADGNLIFHIKPIDSWEEFDDAHPRPEPPKILRRGKQEEDFNDPSFKVQVETWSDLRQAWLVIKCLTHDQNDIEWERVELDKPQTWLETKAELKEAGLIEAEYWYLLRKIYAVNALTEEGMEAARANFLLMTSVGQNDE